MAEVVQQNLEGMIPELQELTRVRLFTFIETRKILKKRRAYEYKLQRQSKNLNDFLNYIQYEINVLALIKKRREKTGYFFKKEEIEYNIIHRIHRTFKVARNRFPNDVKLWLSHIDFCQQWNQKAMVSGLFTKMLQIHSRKPELWILAAKWEFDDNANPENARNLLQRGLRFNSTAKQLWLEYYRMELLFAEKLRLRREVLKSADVEDEESLPDGVLQGLVASVVYKNAIEAFPGDVDFLVSFLPVCKLFSFTQEQEEQIYADLKKHYGDSPKTWDVLAWRYLNRNKKSNRESDVTHFYDIFDEAVAKVRGEEIWDLYINGSLEILQFKCDEQLNTKRIAKTLEIFDKAATQGTLSENLYEKMVEVLTNLGMTEKIQDVLQAATSLHSKSLSLWKQRLQMLMRNSVAVEDVVKVFNKACHNLPEKDTADLWLMLMEYCIINQSESTEKLFQRGLHSVTSVSGPLKELYMQWVILTQSIEKTREIYRQLLQMRPVPLQVIKYYVEVEQSQPKPKMKMLRQAYEDAVLEYGCVSSDLWLDYIKLEMTHPKGKPENAGKLHCRAIKNLEGELNQKFITQYTLLQTGHMDWQA